MFGGKKETTPTRSRTRNVSFEARHDVRFTIGARVDRRRVELRFPLCERGVFPLDERPKKASHPVPAGDNRHGRPACLYRRRRTTLFGISRGGSRTHKVTGLSTWPLCRICVLGQQCRVQESHLARRRYEPQPDTRPPVSDPLVSGPHGTRTRTLPVDNRLLDYLSFRALFL